MRNLELNALFKQSLYGSVPVLIAALVLTLICAPWRPLLLGLAAGVVLGMINAWLLVNSIQKLVAFVLQQSREFGQALYVFGMVVRWLVLFAAFIYICWRGYCDPLGLLAGYFVLPLLAVARVLHILLSPRVDSNYS